MKRRIVLTLLVSSVLLINATENLYSQTAENYFKEGSTHYENGAYDEAIECYKKAIGIKPAYETAWNALGDAYYSKNLYDEAMSSYKKAVELKPDYAKAWRNLGAAYFYKDLYDEAIECYKKAVELKPDYAKAWNGFGAAYSWKDLYDEAIECYKKAVELKPDYAKAWNGLGAAYLRKDLYDKAIECHKKAIEIKPDYASAWRAIGCAYSWKDLYYHAISCYEKAIKLEANYQAWKSLGNIYYGLELYGTAGKCFGRAWDLEKKGDLTDKLAKCADKVQLMDKDDPKTKYDVGLHFYYGGWQCDRAITMYKAAIQLKPNYAEVWYNLGRAYHKMESYRERLIINGKKDSNTYVYDAIASWRKCIEIAPNSEVAKLSKEMLTKVEDKE